MATDALLADMRREGLAAGTITTAEYRLEHFFQLAKNGNRPLSWLRLRGQELYDAAQVNRSADTHQAELALAKQVGTLAVKRRWLRVNPFDGIENVGRKRHGSTKPRHTVDEAVRLQAYCLAHPEDQGAVVTLAACGDNLPPEPEPDAPADASPDASPDADPCWRRVVVECENTLIQLCVPHDGCAFYTCMGESYGYCGPGPGSDAGT